MFAVPGTIELWTDGACSGNPGPGGWAAILVARAADGAIAKQVELSGGDPGDDEQPHGAAGGHRAACRRSSARRRLTVHIDSSYVMDAIVKGWHVGWASAGWQTAAKQPVKNRELWEALLALVERHTITWHKVKGHAGVALNERCDELAVAACHAAAPRGARTLSVGARAHDGQRHEARHDDRQVGDAGDHLEHHERRARTA